MKLDAKNIRHLSNEDWKVLKAVEQGSRNHELVPTKLIESITKLRNGSAIHKSISTLAKSNLISRMRNASYDGYRLTYGGMDYLALHTHVQNGSVYSVGNQIGMGKESDIYACTAPTGRRLALKIHRLGRISFRTVKTNRDYLRKGSSGSWMYMSTLAAQKEYNFMCALREAGFPVPEPVDRNRHTVVMALIDAFQLNQISKVPDPASLYARLMELILRLAKFGLIHGDFNEHNILIEELGRSGKTIGEEEEEEDEEIQTLKAKSTEGDGKITLNPIIIDFPQTVSISHPNAEFYFDRDVNCIKRCFEQKFRFVSDEPGPFFADAIADAGKGEGIRRLDLEVEASGFNKKLAKELEKYMKQVGVEGVGIEGEEYEGEDEQEHWQGLEEDVRPEDDALIPIENVEHGDLALAVQNLESQDLVGNMNVLQLSEKNVAALDNQSISGTSQAPPSVTSKTNRNKFSHTGTVSSRRPVNPAKVARGWAI